MDSICDDLKEISKENLPYSPEELICQKCKEEGTTWVNLRQCQVCGNIGCCDSSPGQHATKHYKETGHKIMASAEPGQNWAWCYEHESMKNL